MAEISICFEGSKVTAMCSDNKNKVVGTLGTQFSIGCNGKTVYITATSGAEGSKVYYSVDTTGSSSLSTKVVTDTAGACATIN